MKIFVTGHRGYIGPHVIELLKRGGHHVTGCDINLFLESQIAPVVEPDRELLKDIRQLSVKDLKGYDCVVHLAAISNDPMGDINPEITYSINLEGSIKLAELSKAAGVRKFLFASSCSIYGKGENLDLTESAAFNPLTPYAISKIETEKALRQMADDSFSPVYLRNSTAYGFSPMFRIDLVVNNLLACALAKGNIQMKSDGQPWRPLIHCRDIAHAFVAIAETTDKRFHNRAVNIGANDQNFQVKDVAREVQELVPQATVVFTGEVGSDPRDYRVNFDLLTSLLPDFRFEYTLKTGMKHLLQELKKIKFDSDDFDGERFVRLKLLKKQFALAEQL